MPFIGKNSEKYGVNHAMGKYLFFDHAVEKNEIRGNQIQHIYLKHNKKKHGHF